MRIRVSSKDLSRQKADLAVCFAYEGDTEPRGVTDSRLRKELASRMKAEGFKALPGDLVVWNADSRYASERFAVIGLGKEKEVPGEAIRSGSARAAREAARFSARTLALRLPGATSGSDALEARASAEGAILGAYQFDRYLSDPARREVKLRTLELAINGASQAVADAVQESGCRTSPGAGIDHHAQHKMAQRPVGRHTELLLPVGHGHQHVI